MSEKKSGAVGQERGDLKKEKKKKNLLVHFTQGYTS